MKSELVISKVTAIPIQIPRIKPFGGSTSLRTTSEQVIVQIEVADAKDLCGFGECSFVQKGFQIFGEDQVSAAMVIERHLAPAVIGCSAYDLEVVHQRMERAIKGMPYAKAAVDVAVHDLLGKALNVPVYRLLGGLCRNQMPTVLSISMQEPDGMAADAKRLMEKGYERVTLKIGSGIREDVRRVSAVREAVGDGIEIEIDPNQAYTVDDAIRLMRLVDRYRIDLLEQPVAWWNIAGMAEVRRATGVPLAADESAWTGQHVLEIIKQRAADIIVLKYQKDGGLFRARKMAAIIEAAGLKINVGSLHPTSVGAAAVHHLAASVSSLDGGVYGGPLGVFTDDIATKPIAAVNGIVHIQPGPGLGVDVDRSKLEKYRV